MLWHFFLPGRVVRVWMNCIGAISFQRSWKAHITHLARKVDILVFRDFGGFKFFDQLSKNAKQYSHQHHCAPSPQGLWQRSPYWLRMVGSIEILSSIEDFWSRCFPLTLCTCTHRSQQTSHDLTTWWVISIHAVIWILCHLTLFVSSINQYSNSEAAMPLSSPKLANFRINSSMVVPALWKYDSSLEF